MKGVTLILDPILYIHTYMYVKRMIIHNNL